MEVIFISLDRPDDVKKLLGMELTWAWVNEGRELEKEIIDALTWRVGRFPAQRDGGCIDPQIFIDTNSRSLATGGTCSPNQRTPPAKRTSSWWSRSSRRRPRLRAKGVLKPKQLLFEFLAQPSALSPDAENLINLRTGYYSMLGAGKTDDWRKVYIRENEYGYGCRMDAPCTRSFAKACTCASLSSIRSCRSPSVSTSD